MELPTTARFRAATYRAFVLRERAEADDTDAFVTLMAAYYQEDHQKVLPKTYFEQTLVALAPSSSRGTIIGFYQDRVVAGYAILVPYWSNEFGGNVMFIDELYVQPQFRGQGVASFCVRELVRQAPSGAKALQLETTASNVKVRELYQRLGFDLSSSVHLQYHLEPKNR